MKRRIGLGILAFVLATANHVAWGQAVVYVDANVVGSDNTGATWPKAYTNLQTAIQNTGLGTQIWVAAATYYPGTDRTSSFALKTNMQVYGGFTNGMSTFGQRDWNAYPTILSGEVQQDGSISNNAYHVVVGATNAVLDGFTIAYGCANGNTPDDRGGGVVLGGGTVAPIVAGTQTIANCTFLYNYATNGAAVYGSNSTITIVNSLFASNTAANGGAVYSEQFAAGFFPNAPRQVNVTNCLFRQNTAISKGGAMYYNAFQALKVQACQFIGNRSTSDGGAVYTFSSWQVDPGITNCLFVANTAGGNGGGMANGNPGANVYNCSFSGNTAAGGGGGVSSYNGGMVVNGSLFAGNTATAAAGAVYAAWKQIQARNCRLVGNQALGSSGGGGFYQYAGGTLTTPSIFTNCTISGNWAKYSGGGIATYAGQNVCVGNCIIWSNTASAGSNELYGVTNTLNFTDVRGGWSGVGAQPGSSNFDLTPLFAGGPTGTWTAVGSYDAVAGQTMLTDGSAAWTAGEHVGRTLNPNTAQYLQFLVFTNSATTITVWGNAAATTAVGRAYQIYDYHLKSKGGRWTPLHQATNQWVKDSVHSPCIDAGDTNSAYAAEPMPNGDRINMGFDGNTVQASMSKPTQPPGTVVFLH